MSKRRLATRISILTLSGLLLTASSSAKAQSSFPVYHSGRAVFRPAYLRKDGPQPFSTRRDRELQAMRSKTSSSRLYLLSSTRSKNSRGILNPRRTPLFSRRFGRFR